MPGTTRFGQENADKCAWTFGTTYNNGTGLANMKIGAKDFLIQQNWVNAGNGGCLQGLGGSSNQPPVAAFTFSCTTSLLCTFDGTGSTDDVGITAYSLEAAPTAHGVYRLPASASSSRQASRFDLMLTVTDGGGLSQQRQTHTIMVTGGGGGNQPPVANFVDH